MTDSALTTQTISRFWRRHVWVRPLIVLAVLAVVGWWLRAKVEESLRTNLQSVLQTTLEAEREAVRNWVRMQQNIAASAVEDEEIKATIRSLLAEAKPNATSPELINLPQSAELRRKLEPLLAAHKYNGFVILEGGGRIAAAYHNELVGKVLTEKEMRFIRERVFCTQPMMLPPIKSKIEMPDRHGVARAGVPIMYAAAPIRSETGEIVAAFGFRIQPEVEFTEILKIARIGTTGETYAFDRNGVMLSNSRFDKQLRKIKLLKEGEDSTLNISLRDPGVDLTAGSKPILPPDKQPLTYMATEAAAEAQTLSAERVQVDIDGHRDYRGVPVVGAWQWLDDEGFGIATKVDISEANQTLDFIGRAFWGLYALL
ncbi:MAG: cache domain-containing protein, partial [Planctomycetaceae bacterium]|nr:cache domain-containing protein [Planctomycetaceae bacterium]